MGKVNRFLVGFLCIAVIVGFTACDEDKIDIDEDDETVEVGTNYAILNITNHSYGSESMVWVSTKSSLKEAKCFDGEYSETEKRWVYHITGLTSNTKYYYRYVYGYAFYNDGSYSSVRHFRTKKGVYDIFTDSKTTLDLSDDAACANRGGTWRTPTEAEWQELEDNCTWNWTSQNGVNGYEVSGNGNSIFLPAVGCRDGKGLYGDGSYGHYWSSSLSTSEPYIAYYYGFNSNTHYVEEYGRYFGNSVRPVCER